MCAIQDKKIERWQAYLREVITHQGAEHYRQAEMLKVFAGELGDEARDCALQAVQAGFPCMSITSQVLGLRESFASLCVSSNRLDVLRAVLELPCPGMTKPQWMALLCAHGMEDQTPPSLARMAHKRMGAEAGEAYELVLDIDPQHPDITALMNEDGVARAVLAEILMARRLASLPDHSQLAAPGARNARRLSL